MTRALRSACLLAIASAWLGSSPTMSGGAAGKVGVLICYLGGPDVAGEGTAMIQQLVEHLEADTGLGRGTFDGAYVNDLTSACAFLSSHPSSFILGSTGFFLANRTSSGLAPLATIRLADDGAEKYYVVVKKGRYKTLDELKGKTLSGNQLFEDPHFINAIVFAGRLDAATHFVVSPSNRPLSALRKVEKGEIDAVLLNRVQYESLTKLTTFDSYQILYASEPVVPLGFMMTDTERTRTIRDRLLTSIVRMCSTPKGKPVCGNFGIAGFDPLKPGALAELQKRYDAGSK